MALYRFKRIKKYKKKKCNKNTFKILSLNPQKIKKKI